MPQPLIGCGREGWELVARGESGARVRPGGWQKALHLPRDAHAGALAACQLGYPVTLTPGTQRIRLRWRPLGGWHTEPVYYVSPAGAGPAALARRAGRGRMAVLAAGGAR